MSSPRDAQHLELTMPSQSRSRNASIDPMAPTVTARSSESAGTPFSASATPGLADSQSSSNAGISAGLAVPYMLPEARYASPAAVPEFSARFWADLEDAALSLTRLPGSPALSAAASAEARDGPGTDVLRAISAAVHACQSDAVRDTGAIALHQAMSRIFTLARESPEPAPVISPMTVCDALRAQMLVVLLEAGLARALVFAAMSQSASNPASCHPLLQRASAATLQYVVALSTRLLPSPFADAAWHLPDLVQVRRRNVFRSAHFYPHYSIFLCR